MEEREQRYFCPTCGQRSASSVCPQDNNPTLDMWRPSGLTIGSVIAGRYRVVNAIGSGAMGVVFRAIQIGIDRPVAIKVYRAIPDLAETVGAERFYREARSASQLHHPNIVKVYDYGVDALTNTLYMAMEYVDGRTLGEMVKEEGPLEEKRAAIILEQVARALVVAHRAGIVHRDLKPGNIMVSAMPDETEHATVLDFGIAKHMNAELDKLEPLTLQGKAVGTYNYMSPEQVSAAPIDGRSDLYALGCVFHTLLVGEPPFSGTMGQVILAHVRDPRPVVRRTAKGVPLSKASVQLHQALLQVEKEDRPVDAGEVVGELHRIVHQESGIFSTWTLTGGDIDLVRVDLWTWLRKRRRFLVALLAPIAVLVFLLFQKPRGSPADPNVGPTVSTATQTARLKQAAPLLDPSEGLDSQEKVVAEDVLIEVGDDPAEEPATPTVSNSDEPRGRRSRRPRYRSRQDPPREIPKPVPDAGLAPLAVPDAGVEPRIVSVIIESPRLKVRRMRIGNRYFTQPPVRTRLRAGAKLNLEVMGEDRRWKRHIIRVPAEGGIITLDE